MLNRTYASQPIAKPHPGARWHGRRIVVAMLLVAAMVALPATAAPQQVNGTLTTVDSVRVLKVWGNAHQRGYAHGYLLAQEIHDIFEDALFHPSMMPNPHEYEMNVANTVMSSMGITGDREKELQGILDGMVAKLGRHNARSKRLARDLEVKDLAAYNTLADWHHMGCSSFAMWGELTGGKGMITGRNLDYMDLPGIREKHILIAHLNPGPGRKSWVSLAWPGLIGAYTAMNADGVTVAMHDAPGLKHSFPPPYVPRSFALREVVERVQGACAIDDAKRILQRMPAMRGNNVMVTVPFPGPEFPAVVFEYDGARKTEDGVTVRTAADNCDNEPSTCLFCTNHYRKRSQPSTCSRYAKMSSKVQSEADNKAGVDTAFAWSLLKAAQVRTTLHSVVFLPNAKELEIALSSPGRAAPDNPHHRLKLTDLLKR